MKNKKPYILRTNCWLLGSTSITPVVPQRDRSDANCMETPENSIISIERYAEVLVTRLRHASQGTLGTAIRAISDYLGTLLTRFQQRMIRWNHWREKQSSILVLASCMLAFFKWLYSPTLRHDLPSSVTIRMIKDRRWAVFRRGAENLKQKNGVILSISPILTWSTSEDDQTVICKL